MSDTATPVRDVAEAAFEADVLQASANRPVVVDFWAPWCGPCHQLSPLLERAAVKYAGEVDVVKVNVDQAPAVARTYRVQGIPAVKAFRDGVVVSEFVGVQPERAVDQFFAALGPSEADRLVTAAAEAPAEQREGLLRRALALDAGHEGACVALARLLEARGDTVEAVPLLERVPASEPARRLLAEIRLRSAAAEDMDALWLAVQQDQPGARLRLGRALAAAGAYDEALAVLIDAVRDPSTRADARAAVLEVFAVAGDGVAQVWRPRLASALF
jgi:putative thioredoxin